MKETCHAVCMRTRQHPTVTRNPLHRQPVFRHVVTSGAEFEAYLNRIGRPRYAITCSGETSLDEIGAVMDEWYFSNDIDSLMREFLDWDTRGIRMTLGPLKPNRPELGERWTVVGLPDHFNEAAAGLNTALLGSMCKTIGEDGARRAFLEVVFEHALAYRFFPLTVDCYDSFIEEWKAEDDKAARPDHYRAQKSFGVVVDAGAVTFKGKLVVYWVSIGWALGRIRVDQLMTTGLTFEALINQICIINGLGEVERIGSHPVRWTAD